MNNKIKLITFDLDGTLVDAFQAVTLSVNAALSQMNLPEQDHQTIRQSVGWGERVLLEKFVGSDRLEEAVKYYDKAHEQALVNGVEFLPGAGQALSRLHEQGYKLSIASNRPTRFTHQILEILNIESYFAFVLCGDKLKRAKPHPDIVIETLEYFSLKPKEAVYVGDMAIDIMAARGAGVKAIGVTTGTNTAEQLEHEKPYAVISGLSELERVLNVI